MIYIVERFAYNNAYYRFFDDFDDAIEEFRKLTNEAIEKFNSIGWDSFIGICGYNGNIPFNEVKKLENNNFKSQEEKDRLQVKIGDIFNLYYDEVRIYFDSYDFFKGMNFDKMLDASIKIRKTYGTDKLKESVKEYFEGILEDIGLNKSDPSVISELDWRIDDLIKTLRHLDTGTKGIINSCLQSYEIYYNTIQYQFKKGA